MKKNLYCFILALIFMLNIACNHNRVTFSPGNPGGEKKTLTSAFFLAGLFPTAQYSVQDLCGKSGVYQVHAETSFLDGLLTFITLSIYSPRTLEVFCNGNAAFKLEKFDEEGKLYLAYQNSPNFSKEANKILIPLRGEK